MPRYYNYGPQRADAPAITSEVKAAQTDTYRGTGDGFPNGRRPDDDDLVSSLLKGKNADAFDFVPTGTATAPVETTLPPPATPDAAPSDPPTHIAAALAEDFAQTLDMLMFDLG